MEKIYISLPISGQEKTYEQRLAAAVAFVQARLPEYGIITPQEIAQILDDRNKRIYGRLYDTAILKPEYKDYLLADLYAIARCHAVFMCNGWKNSKGCLAEYHFAVATGKKIYFQDIE